MLNSVLIRSLRKVFSVNITKHLIQLILGVFIAKSYGADGKGVFFIFITISSMIAVLASFGIVNSLIFHLKNKRIDLFTSLFYLFSSIIFIYIFSLVLSLFINLNEFFGLFFNGFEFTDFFVFSLLAYCAINLVNLFLVSYCLSNRIFNQYWFTFVFSSFFSLVLILILYYLYQISLETTIVLIISCEFLVCLTSYVVLIKKSERFESLVDFKTVYAYGVKVHLGTSGATITTQADSIIASSLLSIEQVGIYSVAKTFFKLLAIIPQSINSLLFGFYCEMDKKSSILFARSVMLKLFFISIIVSSLLFYLLEPIILIAFGQDFLAAKYSSYILIVGAVLLLISAPIHPLLLSHNLPLNTSKVTLYSSIFSIPSCYILTGLYGIEGSALSLLIGSFIAMSFRFYYFSNLKA